MILLSADHAATVARAIAAGVVRGPIAPDPRRALLREAVLLAREAYCRARDAYLVSSEAQADYDPWSDEPRPALLAMVQAKQVYEVAQRALALHDRAQKPEAP